MGPGHHSLIVSLVGFVCCRRCVCVLLGPPPFRSCGARLLTTSPVLQGSGSGVRVLLLRTSVLVVTKRVCVCGLPQTVLLLQKGPCLLFVFNGLMSLFLVISAVPAYSRPH